MILGIDLAILFGVALFVGSRVPFLGVIVFVLGFLFEFQLKRTRLLLGVRNQNLTLFQKIRSGILSCVLILFFIPVLREDSVFGGEVSAKGQDWSLFVVILLGFFAALLMVALGAERRRR